MTKEREEPTADVQFAGSYKLRSPVAFEGETVTEVHYDLNALKAKDVISCRRELARMSGTGMNTEPLMTDDLLHAALVARSAKLPVPFVLEMGAADYGAWAVIGQAFFGAALADQVS